MSANTGRSPRRDAQPCDQLPVPQNEHEIRHDQALFIAAVTHDLRQTIQSISLLAQAGVATEGQRDPLETLRDIGQAAARGNQQLTKLMDTARIDLGHLSFQPQAVQSNSWLVQICRQFPTPAHGAPRYRMVEQRYEFESDPKMLADITRNLVEHAVEQARATRVLIGFKRSPGGLSLLVADNGRALEERLTTRIRQSRMTSAWTAAAGDGGPALEIQIACRLSAMAGHDLHVTRTRAGVTIYRVALGNFRRLVEPS